MAKKSELQNIFERNQYDLANIAKKSRSWFDQQVQAMARQGITPNKVLQSEASQLATKIVPGNMYMYFYDPKMKQTLPYYDRFPLVLPYRATADGFIGLNLHYLPYQLRIVLLDNLMAFKTNNKMNENTRIKYSWAMIDGVSKYTAAQPCIKQYLVSNVRSPFRLIHPTDWATALLLPVERFVGSSKENVWADSKRTIRRA